MPDLLKHIQGQKFDFVSSNGIAIKMVRKSQIFLHRVRV